MWMIFPPRIGTFRDGPANIVENALLTDQGPNTASSAVWI